MKQSNSYRMRLLLVVVVAAIAVGGGSVKADFTFGKPVNLGPIVNSDSWDEVPSISADGLELYFSSYRDGGDDIWVSTRQTIDDEWGPPANLGSVVNSGLGEYDPSISADGLELYIEIAEPLPSGACCASLVIGVAKRAAKGEPWGSVVELDLPLPDGYLPGGPGISADGLELYFTAVRFGDDPDTGLYVARRETIGAPWAEPISLGPIVNDQACQVNPATTSDSLLLISTDSWICSPRTGGFGAEDMWMVRRVTKHDDWGVPVNLGLPVNSPFEDRGGTISADGSTIYFHSDRPGGLGRSDLWQAPVLPVVDFDGDLIVDINDLVLLVESWGTDEPLCDIGPMPWGDGVVDAADLEVLMNYWGQEVGPIKLAAHWKLDEADGITAYDSAGNNDATLFGEPVWQPGGGIIDGALEFDGIDDYVSTPYVIDNSSFSIFAWIKGGAPHQAIIAESEGGINFLMTDRIEGNLMTVFGFFPDGFLVSQAQITDGQWHHVGLVWGGWVSTTRKLYVDGVEVAGDILTECPGGGDSPLRIGTAKDQVNTGLWSGLIDDVRIYNAALSAEEVTALAQ